MASRAPVTAIINGHFMAGSMRSVDRCTVEMAMLDIMLDARLRRLPSANDNAPIYLTSA